MFERLWTLSAAVFLLMTACGELPTEGPAADDEEDAAVVEETSAEPVALEASLLHEGPSTICVAYGSEFLRLQNRLLEQADDPVLRREAISFETLIANTCK